jgi:hypothetical protein
VLRHLAGTISSPKNTVMFVGYQAAGTRGRVLVDGAREIKLLGHIYPWRRTSSGWIPCPRTRTTANRCAGSPGSHAGADGLPRPCRRPALTALAARITTEKQWPVHIAAHHERLEIR